MNPNEPFGLPNGTVRGVLTLMFSGVTLYLWVTGMPVPETLLGVTTLIVGNYFGVRSATDSTPVVAVEPVAAPYIPGPPAA